MAKPTISLCMIVKDEEENLPLCLDSIKDIVDEIIVVDTGSTDKTVEIAKKFGAKVFHHEWKGDFSEARNASLEPATSDWILWLDADEELVAEDANKLKNLLFDKNHDAFFVTEYNFMEHGTSQAEVLTSMPLRIFRNKKEYRFKRPIHEQIAESIKEAGGRFADSGIRINHYGYAKEIVFSKEKIKRNIDILLKDLKENPRDSYANFHLGIGYQLLENYDKAISQFQKAFKCLDDMNVEFAPLIPRNLVVCLKAAKRYDEALKVIEDTLMVYPNFTDLEFVRGLIHIEQGKNHLAIGSFKKCLSMGESPARYTAQRGSGSFRAWDGLGMAYAKIGYNQESVKAFSNALRLNSHDNFALENLGKILLAHDDVNDVRRYLEKLMDLSSEDVLLTLIFLFCGEGYVDEAIIYLNEAEKFYSGSVRVQNAKATCCMHEGDFEAALSLLKGIPKKSLEYLPSRTKAVIAACAFSDFKTAKELVSELNESLAEPNNLIEALMEVLEKGSTSVAFSPRNRDGNLSFLENALNFFLELKRFDEFERALGLYDALGVSAGEKSLRLGKLLYKRGYQDLAAEELLKACEAKKGDAEAFAVLGKACLEKNMLDDAKVFYCHSLEKNPKQLRPYTALAKIHSSLGEKQETINILQEGVRNLPDSEILRETLRTIQATLF
ncbi:MAG TPA: glycosyltransferase [Actinobacteria bacterium]|nr:glycosyltransferase [Actinomycetota bacterium]